MLDKIGNIFDNNGTVHMCETSVKYVINRRLPQAPYLLWATFATLSQVSLQERCSLLRNFNLFWFHDSKKTLLLISKPMPAKLLQSLLQSRSFSWSWSGCGSGSKMQKHANTTRNVERDLGRIWFTKLERGERKLGKRQGESIDRNRR